jgi:predicted lipoprotein with Yx(FWY)xxD motif
VSAFLLQSCTSDDSPEPVIPDPDQMTDPDPDPMDDPDPIVNTVKLAENTTLGKILTDANGMTLYYFSKDTKDTSACTSAGCLGAWPIFYEETITVDTGLDVNDFATIDRTDGEKQTTYQGWPLYYFANDAAAGDTNGEDANNVWYVAKPDYSLMYVSAQLVGSDGINYLGDYTEGEGETKYIVDIEGNTLYAFAPDKKDTNTFTAPDFSNDAIWPIAEITLDKIPSFLNADDFGTIDVFGRTQLTYKGWPLYYFGGDAARGDNTGVSVPAPGVWPIVNVDTPMAPEPTVSVKLADDGTFGSILTDENGMSLYFFSLDTKDNSACNSAGCLGAWPIFYKEDITVDTGLDAADFATIDRADGEKQTTYKGWPLYYFAGDAVEGDTTGDKVNDVWFIAKPDYSLMYVRAQLVGSDGKNYLSDYTEGEGQTFYITDIEGRTLYGFIPDTKDTNTYTQSDFSNNGVWPIAEITLDKIPSILDADDFGAIDVFGRTQLTYKGWPMYYFGPDQERGDNKGVSVPSPGVWPILNIDTTPL